MKQAGMIKTRRPHRSLSPSLLLKRRNTKHHMTQFAEQIGMVYFGSVDQYDDDHKIMRGYTVSITHRDRHYCVGTYKTYDISFVTRTDTVYVVRTRRSATYHMTILSIDLHEQHDTPEFYIGHNSQEDIYTSKPFTLIALPESMLPADRSFHKQYVVRTAPRDIELTTQLLIPHVTSVIADQFDDASIELSDGTLYLYILDEHPTKGVLTKLLSNGLWLSETIDQFLANR